jgi:retron-type reverse transcriptase
VEHEEYAEAYSTEHQVVVEREGEDSLEMVLDGDNLNRASKRVKANKGASGVDGMTIDKVFLG